MTKLSTVCLVAVVVSVLVCGPRPKSFGAEPIRVLFVGDQGHHRPADRFRQLVGPMARRGVSMEYGEGAELLNAEMLAKFDALMIYANIEKISESQESALLKFVESGKGLVALHCASYCFLNSDKYVRLVGAQFRRHGTGVFRAQIAQPNHPVMKGYSGMESWDETYEHHRHHEEGRVVLSYRLDSDGRREPWTWVRTQGKGRVFYTAWGHDHRTWGEPGFQNLVERGLRWAVGGDPAQVPAFDDGKTFPVPPIQPIAQGQRPFEYREAKIAFYPPGRGSRGEGGWNKMQLPVEPRESMKHAALPKGFRLELFASEPDIKKPICMNWDHRGRLWVAETVDYPNDQRLDAGRDRITICEDTNNDGKADKFTVFAEGLSIPTSLTFSRGGVIVHQAPETLFLRDTDGDDRADERRVLFRGWGNGDTHAGPSNLQYGFDNWIWGVLGYAGFNGSVGGESHRFGMGFYRFRPDGSKLEFIRSTNNNTWGLGFSEDGLVFGSTANRNPSVFMPTPNRYYESVRGWAPSQLGTIARDHLFQPITDRVRQVDHHGGYTAGAGHALYTARRYPKEYWNRTAFVAGPTGHLLGVFLLNRKGSDFQSRYLFNLYASDDEWSAPIMAEVGPDGNVWMIDWYNYIVQHNPTPAGFQNGKGNAYRTELRDKRHGRVYRLVYGEQNDPSPALGEGAAARIAALRHSNLFWRRHAQRLLVEAGDSRVAPDVARLLDDQSVDETGLNAGAVHALCVLDGLGVVSPKRPEVWGRVAKALSHPSAAVRMHAARVMPATNEGLAAIVDADLVSDEDPQVRMQALLAIADAPSSQAMGEIVTAAAKDAVRASDRWLIDAATAAAAKHANAFMTAVAATESDGASLAPITRIVAEHFARGDERKRIGVVLESLVEGNSLVREAVVEGLEAGWPRTETSQRIDAPLEELLKRLEPAGKGRLIRLADKMGVESLRRYAKDIVRELVDRLGQSEDEAAAMTLVRQIVAFQPDGPMELETLTGVLNARATPEFANGVFAELSKLQSPELAKALLNRWAGMTPRMQRAAVGALLGRREWVRTLVDSLERGQLSLADLSLDQKQRLAKHPDGAIAKRVNVLLKKGGGLPSPDRAKVLTEWKPVSHTEGDAVKGKAIFAKLCAKCHRYRGEGAAVGPDLTGMAVHPKEELLINILDPSRSVEGNYRVYTAVTVDGRLFSGLLASESRTAIEMFDAEGKKHTILREDIDELRVSPKSLMPEGFEKQATKRDLADLLEFLTQRGRFLPIPLDRTATIVSTRGMFYDENSRVERLVFPDWKPKAFKGVPFHLVDPQNGSSPNVIMLHGPIGKFPPRMPKSVALPCNSPAKSIHLLSGVSGWGAKAARERGAVSMIVRLHYEDGQTEDHALRDGRHFADYIGRFDVPESDLAFMLNGRQIRYLAIHPKTNKKIEQIEFVKGPDQTAPIIMAVTVESPQS